MLNDILAVCVLGAVVVVFATIFGAVELLWKVLHAAGRIGRPPSGSKMAAARARGVANGSKVGAENTKELAN